MHRTRTKAGRMMGAVATLAIAALLAGCGSGSSTPSATSVTPAESTGASSAAPAAPTATSTEPFTIRVAFGSTGEAVDGIFTELKTAYEAKYPGRTVEIIVQEDDVYETIGIDNLLTSRNAPDVYFEWPGARLATKVTDGYGADISAAVADPRFTSRLDPAGVREHGH